MMTPELRQLLERIRLFLEEPEHEIVCVYSEDYWKDAIYCGLALGWEEERDILLVQVRQLLKEYL